MVARQRLTSAILWQPPGVGKTTIARLLAHGSDLSFEPVSATFSGVADLRKVFAAARSRRGSSAPRSSSSNASTKPHFPHCSSAPSSSPATGCPWPATPAAP